MTSPTDTLPTATVVAEDGPSAQPGVVVDGVRIERTPVLPWRTSLLLLDPKPPLLGPALYLGDERRFTDSRVEVVRRHAVLDAVAIVRAGLGQPEDVTADLFRPAEGATRL